jgi:ferric-dicitrate binding protein FerR (iron transport regulator)
MKGMSTDHTDSSSHSSAIPPHRLDAALLDRYLAGECTEAEVATVEMWVAAGARTGGVIAALQRLHKFARPVESDVRDDAAILRLRERTLARIRMGSVAPTLRQIGATPLSPEHASDRGRAGNSLLSLGKRSLRVSRALQWTALVATMVLGVGVRSLWVHRDAPPPVVQHYHTGNAQRATVRLADGSLLILAPATSVEVRPTGVDVTGEVYFSIAPHAARPMTVRTTNAIVRVLGTSFVVRQYAGEFAARVVVEAGRVTVQSRPHLGLTDSSNASTVLSAHMLAQVGDSGVTVTSGIESREYVEWTRGTLVFNRVALGNVVTELARAYGAEIQIADSTLAKYPMRMDVTVADDPLTDVLDDVCKATNAHYTRVGHAYVLAPGRSNTQRQRSVPLRHFFPQPEHAYGR